MASKGQRKERRQNGRVVPNVEVRTTQKASRVSRAAGSLGSQSVRVEQRSNVSPAKQRASAQGAGKRAQNGKQAPRKTPPVQRPMPTPTPARAANAPADSRVIGALHRKWQNLEPHHQQRVYSFILLGLAIFLFCVLTILRNVTWLAAINGFFSTFLGWAAYPFSLGLIVFAFAHLIEGIRNTKFIRWSLVIGLTVLLFLLSAESHLLFGRTMGGVLGTLLVRPLAGWPPVVGHMLLIGLLAIAAIVTFRIRLGHALFVGGLVMGMVSSTRKRTGTGSSSSADAGSPYLGQRPQYSRYGRGAAGQALAEDKEEDDESPIIFEDDFDKQDEDDPLNDINIHKRQVGTAPRGQRPAQALNREAYEAAVQGARQQPLPFNEAVPGKGQNKGKNAAVQSQEMEPLIPLPNKQPVVRTRAAKPAAVESPWMPADVTLLNHPEEVKLHLLGDDTSTLARTIQETLRSFHVEAEVKPEDISIGPTVIRFGIRPTGKPLLKVDEKGKQVPVRDSSGSIVYESRTRVSRIMALQNDLALVLEAKSIRMEAPVPGRPYVGVEVPNKNSRLVTLREVLESKEYQAAKAKSKLAIGLGKDVAGLVRVGDLSRMPHLLIAGATGAGKSVCINAIITSILTQATPDDVRMLMVDPKMVELSMYNGIPHLLAPVVTEVEKVVGLLKVAITEMEKRYRLFSQLGVRNLDSYRKLRAEKALKGDTSLKNLPAIVIIIDELADLMMAAPEEVEGLICRLAQLARATGIHLVVATQRPSVDVITGLIKANIPTRISFMVSSAVDSRTIIDMGGAERLLGRGDMLYLPADAGKPERIQCAFVADDEAERLVQYWRQQAAEHAVAADGKQQAAVTPPVIEPGWEISEQDSDEFELEDDLLDQAEQVVREYERASISLLQRRLRIGYSRAARLIDLLEERGIIGHSEASGRAREVFEGGNGRNGGGGGGEGRTMADVANDIIAEQRAQEEFLKKQAAAGKLPAQKQRMPGDIEDIDRYDTVEGG